MCSNFDRRRAKPKVQVSSTVAGKALPSLLVGILAVTAGAVLHNYLAGRGVASLSLLPLALFAYGLLLATPAHLLLRRVTISYPIHLLVGATMGSAMAVAVQVPNLLLTAPWSAILAAVYSTALMHFLWKGTVPSNKGDVRRWKSPSELAPS